MPSERPRRAPRRESDPVGATVEETDAGDRGAAGESDGVDDDAASDTIEWGPVRHDRLRSLIVGFGVTVAFVGAVLVASVADGVGSTLVSGSRSTVVAPLVAASPGDAFVGVVFVAMLALLTVPYLYLWYTEWTGERGSLNARLPGLRRLRPVWVLVGAAAPVVPWLLGLDWSALGGRVLVAWIWIVPFALLWRGVEVELDPTNHEIRRRYPTQDRSRTDDLDTVIRTRRIDIPRVGTVFLLAYRGNAWYRSTPWLTVPRERADAVESALNDVLARSTGPSRASVPVRAMLALIGCSTLVLGAALSAAGEGGAAVALGALSAPFTLLFLALAARL